MYPSERSTTFGVFVKNVYEELNHKADVRLSVLHKHDRLFNKVVSYVGWILATSLKALFASYDALYIHFISRSSFPAVLIAKMRKKKIVLNFHGSDAYDRWPWSRFARIACDACNLAVFPSAAYMDEVSPAFGLGPDRCFVSPSGGVDPNVFYPPVESFRHAGGSELTVGYVSTLSEQKGIYTLLEALELIKFPFRLIIIGDGPSRANIEKRINERNSKVSVSFLGYLSQAAVAESMRELDLFVFPTQRESLGLVGLEAMMSGVPVIGSDIPSLRGYIHHGEDGFLFKNGSSTALAEVINLYASLPPDARSSMSKAAIRNAAPFSRNRVIDDLFSKFEEILYARA